MPSQFSQKIEALLTKLATKPITLQEILQITGDAFGYASQIAELA